MKEEPLVSVLIPCFNVSSYVERAVQSILVQTHKNLEIWLIDDASTDDTLQKLYAFSDPRIKVIGFTENTQKIGAVNEVLKKVTGDYIAFQDADDWSEPERIARQVNKFQTDQDLGLCLTSFRYTGDKDGLPGKIALTDDELKDGFLYFGHSKNQLELPVCPSMMISGKVLEQVPGYHPYFKGRVAEDIHWIYRILKLFKGGVVNEVLYHYTVRDQSLTGMQFSGMNAKAAYSWPLLARIIYLDIHYNVDVLSPGNENLLNKIELEACEEALGESISAMNKMVSSYKTSRSFRLGNFLLSPARLLLKNMPGRSS